MPVRSIFESIHKRAEKEGIVPYTKKSKEWYYNNLRNIKGISQNKVLNDPNVLPRSRMHHGFMYMFEYDPKHKRTLPVYDRFPLIIHAGPARNGFYGVNLHYLHPLDRAVFLDRMARYADTGKPPYEETTRFFKMFYHKYLKDRRLRAFKLCWKHYLRKHIRSKMVMIPGDEWELSLFLPTERFKKQNKQTVWQNSARTIPTL